jgi:hypothetical protein
LTEAWDNQYPTGRRLRLDQAILTSSISVIESETGHLVLPHTVCSTAEELREIVERMDHDIVSLKAYSGPAAVMMRAAYRAVYEGKPPPTFSEAGLNTEDLTLGSVRRYIKYLLLRVCDDFRPAFLTWRPVQAPYPPVSIEGIALEFSPHVPGQTLLAGTDTEKLAHDIVRPLIAERTLRALEHTLRREEATVKAAQDMASKIKDPEERLDYEQSQEFRTPPQFIPDELIIHTTAHLRKYRGDVGSFPKEFLRRQPPVRTIRKVMDLNTPEWMKHALLAGVVYTDVKLHTDSTNAFVAMIETSLLDAVPVAVVDSTFTYGINVPASNVIVTPDFADKASRNTLIQYINRVSRTGSHSHNGKAFLCRSAILKLFGKDDTEAVTLHLAVLAAKRVY